MLKTIGQSLIPEYDAEMSNTRTMLERVPDALLGWKAHPKSNSIGWVASHLADIPSWTTITLTTDHLDIDPPGGTGKKTTPLNRIREENLKIFDRNVAEGREYLNISSDEGWEQPWTLLKGGQKILTQSKAAVYRTWVISHSIHHRAILSVYFRLNGIPVPGLYGPSGDN